MTFYIIKCLDKLDYERFLSTRKTANLDGKPSKDNDAGDNEEYVWDWAFSEDTVRHREKWAAEKLMRERAVDGIRTWITKIEVGE